MKELLLSDDKKAGFAKDVKDEYVRIRKSYAGREPQARSTLPLPCAAARGLGRSLRARLAVVRPAGALRHVVPPAAARHVPVAPALEVERVVEAVRGGVRVAAGQEHRVLRPVDLGHPVALLRAVAAEGARKFQPAFEDAGL